VVYYRGARPTAKPDAVAVALRTPEGGAVVAADPSGDSQASPPPAATTMLDVSQLPLHPNANLIDAVESQRKRPLLALVFGDAFPLDFDLLRPFYDVVRDLGRPEELDVFLYSRGGVAEVPWRIVSVLRDSAKRLGVLIPHLAHSGATHIALGADEIVMGQFAELGPVDPTSRHPLLPPDREGRPLDVSVQNLSHVMEFLTGRAKERKGLPADALAQLFQYIHPLAIGQLEQSHLLSELITKKMLAFHMDPKRDKKRIARICRLLGGGYCSHRYCISRREAKDELGLPVTYASASLESAMDKLYKYYQQQWRAQYKGPNGEVAPVRNAAFIDSKTTRAVGRELLAHAQEEGKVIERILGRVWSLVPAGGGNR
jgi:hypothetical protein